jgi:hypothetical protein
MVPSHVCRVLLAVCIATASAYTTATLQRFAKASSLSYFSLEKMVSSPYYEESGLEPLVQVVDPQTESGATIFLDGSLPDSRRLVIAFRGSANPKNFGTNLKLNLVPATRLSQVVPDKAMVHEGFQEASLCLWRRLGPQLMDVLKEKDKRNISQVVFTGHSLGAATALLCGVHYNAAKAASSDITTEYLPAIVTFGGPKLCNGELARHIRNEALEGWNILHLVHDKDPVLANNKKLWDKLGFENVGIEMQVDPNAPTVFTDDDVRKPRAIFGNFAWNILDHCKYMGIFVGPRL